MEIDADDPSTDSDRTKSRGLFRRLLFVPRFSLRTLMLVVALIAVLIPVGQISWKWFVVYRDGREYDRMQATKDDFVEEQRALRAREGGSSHTIDEGRPIPDDFVVLVRKGDTFGCFTPREQNQKGESLKYEWYYRTDGLGLLDNNRSTVKKGESFAGPYRSGSGKLVTVTFGPFSIEWSGNDKGWGFLYFEDEAPSGEPVRICTTNRKTVQYLDARSPEWIYKAHGNDPGVSGDAEIRVPSSE